MRPDLLALTPQAIASLANVGLVKRAQKELDSGKGPRLEELADGTVVGAFEDGNTARLVPGKGLKDSPCSCGATGACRHRVAVALAYPAFARGGAPAAQAPAESPAGTAEIPEAPWTPGAVEDEALAKVLPARALERASALRNRGYVAQVRRGASSIGDEPPAVALATCTVRFLVPRDLAYARCDCAAGAGCEHVALAVWAFRAADERDATARELSVEVLAGSRANEGEGSSALDAAGDLAGYLLLEGAQHAAAGLSARFAVARSRVAEAKLAWVSSALEEVEELLSAYAARGARYSPAKLAAGLAEVFARSRAGRISGALPARVVLGLNEVEETKLDHVRLISLGARLFADGRERGVEMLLADPGAAGLLVLRRAYTYPEEQPPEDGPDLGRRLAAPGASVEVLAKGQVVTTGAVRRPNRQVVFTSRGLQRTSVTPQSGDWSILPAPLLVSDVSALEETLRGRPPRALRPRLLAENVFAFAVSRVVEVSYAPGAQAVRAKLEDPGGRPFSLELAHRRVAPGALDALTAGLEGQPGRIRYVSGDVRRTAQGLVVEPVALACEGGRVVVLDLQPATGVSPARTDEESPELPPLAAALAQVEGCLADAAHQGLRHVVPAWRERLGRCAARAKELGLKRLADALEALGARLAAARASGREEDETALAAAWADAALRVSVALEQLAG